MHTYPPPPSDSWSTRLYDVVEDSFNYKSIELEPPKLGVEFTKGDGDGGSLPLLLDGLALKV